MYGGCYLCSNVDSPACTDRTQWVCVCVRLNDWIAQRRCTPHLVCVHVWINLTVQFADTNRSTHSGTHANTARQNCTHIFAHKIGEWNWCGARRAKKKKRVSSIIRMHICVCGVKRRRHLHSVVLVRTVDCGRQLWPNSSHFTHVNTCTAFSLNLSISYVHSILSTECSSISSITFDSSTNLFAACPTKTSRQQTISSICIDDKDIFSNFGHKSFRVHKSWVFFIVCALMSRRSKGSLLYQYCVE